MAAQTVLKGEHIADSLQTEVEKLEQSIQDGLEDQKVVTALIEISTLLSNKEVAEAEQEMENLKQAYNVERLLEEVEELDQLIAQTKKALSDKERTQANLAAMNEKEADREEAETNTEEQGKHKRDVFEEGRTIGVRSRAVDQ